MFRPLAWTKTLAVGFSSLLAHHACACADDSVHSGRLRPESRKPAVPLHTSSIPAHPPVSVCGSEKRRCCSTDFLVVTLPLRSRVGSQFMPPLFERFGLVHADRLAGDFRLAQASQLLQEQDRIIRTFPEVETVFGTIGRSDSATDNAPLDMYDTTIMLKRERMAGGDDLRKLFQEMDAKLQFQDCPNTWTMPVENRLGHGAHRTQTPLGDEIQAADSRRHPAGWVRRCQQVLRPSASSDRLSERVSQGFYVDIEVRREDSVGLRRCQMCSRPHFRNRREAVTENIEGRERYPRSRYKAATSAGHPT